MGEVINKIAESITASSRLSTTEPSPIKGPAEEGKEEEDGGEEKHGDNLVDLKYTLIARACHEKDIDALIGYATSEGGFLKDDLRRKAWPILTGSDSEQGKQKHDASPSKSWQDRTHRDEDQVRLDVNRAFVYYPNGESEKEIEGRKSTLSDLIIQVLREHPMLCYFQGYHDIAQVFLLVLGKELAPEAVSRMSLLRIRDYMLPSLNPSLRHLQIIPSVLQSADPELARLVSRTQPYFALAATLTLYAHDIQEYSDIARLYDFILAHEPVVAIYLFTAIVISRREELLQIPLDEPEMLHFTLSKLPQPLDLEMLISKAMELFRHHPPDGLHQSTWYQISSHSVLKTSRKLNKQQSLEEGEKLFAKQVAELRREDLQKKTLQIIRRHQVPAISITLALVTGVVSLWLARNGHEKAVWHSMTKLGGVFGLRR